MRLEWITEQPSPYNDFLFRALTKAGLPLNVRFMRPSSDSYPWRSEMAQGFASRISRKFCGVDLALCHLLLKSDITFVVGGWNCVSRLLLLSLAILLRRPFVIWTDTPNLSQARPATKAVLRQAFLKWVFRHAEFVMSTGQPGLSALRKMDCPESKLLNMPYFIDTDYFRPTSRSRNASELILLSCGRLVNNLKGGDVALTAVSNLRREYPELYARIRFRVAGDGPDRAAMVNLSRELQIDDRVEFLGWLEPQELQAFYADGDIFIHTARWDPYATVVPEAMSSGLAVLGSDATGAVMDRVQDGWNGMIHKAGDARQLAQQLAYILERTQGLKAMQLHARETALRWTVDVGVATIRDAIRTISKRRGLRVGLSDEAAVEGTNR